MSPQTPTTSQLGKCVVCHQPLEAVVIWVNDRLHHPECLPITTLETSRKRPWKCPVCDGQGHLNRPPWVAGDQLMWTDSDIALHQCHACSGSGIVWGPQ